MDSRSWLLPNDRPPALSSTQSRRHVAAASANKRKCMSTLYTTLWMITQAYAAPLGYYGSVDACQTVANDIAVPKTAQVLCVPSDTAMPDDHRNQPLIEEPQQGAAMSTRPPVC